MQRSIKKYFTAISYGITAAIAFILVVGEWPFPVTGYLSSFHQEEALRSRKDVVLKIGGDEQENFVLIGRLRDTDFVMNAQLVDNRQLDSQGWRKLLESTGTRSVNITGNVFFGDPAAERTLRDIALAAIIRNYRLEFENGSVITGAFGVRTYGRFGKLDGEENYKITLESSGPVTFTDPE